MRTNHHVFVYGTLKTGFHNHYLLAGSDFIGAGETVNKYAMYQHGIPYVIKEEAVSRIRGEVYAVNDDTIVHLDRLERHPEWYYREVVDVLLANKSSIIPCWLYFFPNAQGLLIRSGIYELPAKL